jgi:zeta-carotene desaturase
MPMSEWLRTHGQNRRVVELFWRQVLVSAVNEELDRMSAYHGLQVFRLAFLAGADAYHMGVPAVTLGELYDSRHWNHWPDIRMHFRSGVASVNGVCRLANGREAKADFYVVAVPVEHVRSVLPDFEPPPLEHSPITGVHLWFDRCVTDLPHATLLQRNIQWMFNKGGGRHLQLVISASRGLVSMSRSEILGLCLRELSEFFPAMKDAALLKSHVVKEVRATISAQPGLASVRPGVGTRQPNVFVAGDWTWTGWPSTMEGAVRSGYAAAEAVCAAAGHPARFLLPDTA